MRIKVSKVLENAVAVKKGSDVGACSPTVMEAKILKSPVLLNEAHYFLRECMFVLELHSTGRGVQRD